MIDWAPCAKDAISWKHAQVPDCEMTRYLLACKFDVQPKQYDFISCPADDVGFGGSRGGAKSYAILGDWLWHDKQYGANAIGIVFRRERTQLTEFIEVAKKVFSMAEEGSGGKWKWHALDKFFESPNGSRLLFAYIDKDSDADKYQGHGYSRIYIEERGTFSKVGVLNKLRATLRSGSGVPCQMKSTFNPGGVGHQHCKEDYRLFDKIPKGYDVFTTDEGITRVFIPSKLADNKYLGDDYVRSLRAACAGNDALLQAWLVGDWSIIEGAFFHAWSGVHVIEEFSIPEGWLLFRSMCWGSARPLSVGWWCVVGNDYPVGGGLVIPRGSIIRYREWYATKARGTNEGQKLTADQIAEGIKQREVGERIVYGSASPQIFLAKGGPSIAERMSRMGVFFMPGDDARAAKHGHLSGWDAVRQRLVGTDGLPAIYCFQTCADSVRTIPALQHDRDDPEELDGESEAAAAHDWRFACMSRPWVPHVAPVPIPDHFGFVGQPDGSMKSTLTFAQIVAAKTRERKREED
ncbi:MAG: hypothetical protein JWO95_3418 [Verrucomicrobiales bacterium]|nr:hypothetical protein [Verrucomicrobiales bacterium]